MAMPVAIIDSGGANIASLGFALGRLGVESVLTTDAAVIRAADRVILPGVGAARDAMERLQRHGLVDVIRELEQPVLGICLGMQLLCEASEEYDVDCLGIIPGTVTRLHSSETHRVPNMGWCEVEQTVRHALIDGLDDGSYFYFVHSYALPVGDYTLAIATHETEFSAVIGRDNFVATQFHPERSSTPGSIVLCNFLGLSA